MARMRGTLQQLEASLDELVPELLRRTGVPGLSAAVWCEGEVSSRAWGLHDAAARRPMTPRSLFPVGSMTKLYDRYTESYDHATWTADLEALARSAGLRGGGCSTWRAGRARASCRSSSAATR